MSSQVKKTSKKVKNRTMMSPLSKRSLSIREVRSKDVANIPTLIDQNSLFRTTSGKRLKSKAESILAGNIQI